MPDSVPVIIEDYRQHLKLERGLSENSLEAYIRDLMAFARVVKGKDLRKITPVDINSYFLSLSRKGSKPATLARKISSLKGFYAYLKENHQIKENPALAYNAPRIARYHPDYLSPKEILGIIEAIDVKSKTCCRDKAIIELLYGSGLRLSELINLKISDLELEAGFLRVLGKGNKQRLVPVGEYTKQALNAYFETGRQLNPGVIQELVFVNRTGSKFSRVGLWKIIKKLVLQAGLTKKVTPHTFRHSFATHLLEGGASLRVVQEMLGHADITTTEIYTKIDRDYIIAEHKKYHPRELGEHNQE
ncbi:MAG: site-specific tyrosine recombinase XerD [candidate division Zixibacteria bacterium]|nr:site-specific tyrosine recombinase XerD [candidate division Zixibacteria bacterium]MDD5425733.1 site-specific tyrosine recombinase XerD [candidate division Zixibacteria bacterium]